MEQNTEYPMIPPEEIKCIWMDGGVIGYKLCDRKYECEGCPFDLVIRQQHLDKTIPATAVPSAPPGTNHAARPSESGDDYFEERLDVFLQPLIDPELPRDRLYYRNHIWVKDDISDFLKIGIDHLGVQMLRTVTGIVLPQTPSRVKRDAPCVWLIHHDGAVALRSPVAGNVTYANRNMKDCPYLIVHYPYSEGWMLLLAPDDPGEASARLLNSDDAADVYRKQGKVLRSQFLEAYDRMRPQVGQTMNDGGVELRNLPDIIGMGTYYEIVNNIFQIL